MTQDTRIAITPASMPALSMEQALARRDQLADFVKRILVPGTDYGTIPGTAKDTLYKPGSEKLLLFFGLRPNFLAVQTIEDWTGANYGGEAFFYYHQKCILHRDGEIMAEGDGSCNSRESRYRYRKGERLCPACGKAFIIKGKEEYGGGWLCWKKNGGCGATFKDGDAAIEGQQVGKVLNPDVADLTNTILKMAQKRALVAATLIGVNASDYFTQDLEDGPGQGDVIEGESKVIQDKPAAKTAPEAAHKARPRPTPSDDRPAAQGADSEVGKTPAAPTKHWTQTQEIQKFWMVADGLGYLNAKYVREADRLNADLGVARLSLWPGTPQEALDKLRALQAPAPVQAEFDEQEAVTA
jgi:hypothetical protein